MGLSNTCADNELLELIKSDDQNAFFTLYNRYSGSLIKYAAQRLKNADDAADVVHDVFLKAWTGRQHIGEVKPYLYALLRNRIIDFVRRNGNQLVYIDMLASLAGEGHVFSMEDEINARDLQRVIEKEVYKLPPRTREIYNMSRKNHLSIPQIAASLFISEQTVKNQLSAANAHLRKIASLLGIFNLIVLIKFLID